jgi:pentatricopeptide repeat protein
MINTFGLHGQGKDALEWFKLMQLNGVQPNSSTFVSAISACGHAGMVVEGLKCLESVNNEDILAPETKHYACAVDVSGRAGRLREAHDFIKRMPIETDDGVWGSLLGTCRIHKDMKLGKIAALKALELNKPEEPGHYILLTNIYAAEGK